MFSWYNLESIISHAAIKYINPFELLELNLVNKALRNSTGNHLLSRISNSAGGWLPHDKKLWKDYVHILIKPWYRYQMSLKPYFPEYFDILDTSHALYGKHIDKNVWNGKLGTAFIQGFGYDDCNQLLIHIDIYFQGNNQSSSRISYPLIDLIDYMPFNNITSIEFPKFSSNCHFIIICRYITLFVRFNQSLAARS